MTSIRKRKRAKMLLGRWRLRHGLLLFALLSAVLEASAVGPLRLLMAPTALNGSNDQTYSYHCNKLPSWTGATTSPAGDPTYSAQDCIQAIRLFETDVGRNPGQAQWLSLKFRRPLPGYGTPVWTPKRYTFGEFIDSLSIEYTFLYL